LRRARDPPCRGLGQHMVHYAVQLWRYMTIEDVDGRRCFTQNSLARGNEAAGFEGMVSGESFVEDYAQREDVGPAIRKLLQEHFRGHVGWRATQDTYFFKRSTLVAARETFSYSEVQDFYLLVGGKHDLFRFYLVVHDAVSMRHH